MKKILFAVAMVATTLFASCSKDANEGINQDLTSPVKGSVVTFSFASEGEQTRAFFSPTATAEAWEKSVSAVVIYAFKDGEMQALRAFTDAEVAAKRATFPIDGVEAGDQCNFYAVANSVPMVGFIGEDEFLDLYEDIVASYNGTFAKVSTSSAMPNGFVMTGSTTATVTNGTTNVAMTLKRTVAKVAVQTTKSDDFNNIYLGDIRVDDITVSKGATESYMWKRPTFHTGERTFSFMQSSNASGDNYQNLFYLYENGATSDKVMLTINATYDTDGNFATTGDQRDLVYELPIEGKAAGEIMRNGYYRINVKIKAQQVQMLQ